MLRGFYTAASGMIAGQRMQETLTNNMTNSNTPGYKADTGTLRAFPELLIQEMGAAAISTSQGGFKLPVRNIAGTLNTGVYMQETVPEFSQGDLRETGQTTDLALLNGNLPDDTGFIFFNVQNENGEIRYTRNGNFTIDSEGFLTTNQGYFVLDNNGHPIQTEGLDFTVSSDGTMDMGGQEVLLGLSYTPNALNMIKEGNNLFRLDEGDAQNARETEADYEVRQKVLEGSNVDPARTMTEMIHTYRTFEMNQRALKAYDQSLQRTVNDIGKLG
ncbi:flagellar hook-basal body protein [Halobacillus massiliensis]|uniref:flagellar hook-basal body protein n=1 Tax=Halobacillus massiliensis TaxID=1926286 RepID=UPI0009E59155|nr:flagellar hook-basal body protein [Halobacillus massiliensis]